MARYIDADNLVERLKVSPIFQDFGTDGYFIRDMVIDLVGCRPTSDVVPKSEVEELKVMLEINNKAYESLRELYHIDTNALVEARRKTEVEVAREIFEEIEEGIKAAFAALQFERNPIHRKVKNETYSSLMRFIVTVEKKYTGGEEDEARGI